MNTQEALAWIAELFEESPDAIEPDTLRDDIPAWDSLGVLNLMAELDEEFDILLTDEEIQEMKTVNDIIELLKRNNKLD